MGANGLPMTKKVVTWEESQETETLQEILEVNPNSSPVEEDFDEELEEEEDEE